MKTTEEKLAEARSKDLTVNCMMKSGKSHEEIIIQLAKEKRQLIDALMELKEKHRRYVVVNPPR